LKGLSLRGRVRAHLLGVRERDAALAYLKREARRNLMLLEMVASVGHRGPSGELPPQIIAAWRDRQIVGIASLRPSVVLDAEMDEPTLAACLPLLAGVEMGLIKSPSEAVGWLWEGLRQRGRYSMIDREEIGYAIAAGPASEVVVDLPVGARLRPASEADLEDLVEAARASLREEDRPDPFDGDPSGFRRWVRGRVPRARVVELDGRVAFVGYADVRRPEGWLVQGVYTWPAFRRCGLARAGMAGLVREAMSAGTDHVQLAVVAGNHAAIELYRGLGFEPFITLRTILFM
jgi:ribosomal protein S18 acetylase RimI-like enzyme